MVMLRYIISGAFNSLLGLAVIALCMAVFAWPPLAANAAGYAAGFVLSFFLHRNFTFRSDVGLLTGGVAYVPVVAAAYLANVAVLLGFANWLHLNAYLAQIFAVAAYVIVGFVGSSKFVFHQPRP